MSSTVCPKNTHAGRPPCGLLQRVIKDLIKVAVKVAVLHRSGYFNPSELALATRVRSCGRAP